MIDIHSHILVGVDDGPDELELAMKMFEVAIKEGVTDIISTSHSFHPQYNVEAHTVKTQVTQLQQRIDEKQMPLKLHTGQEIRLVENVVQLLQTGEALPLANSKYVLLELPSSTVPHFTKEIVTTLIREHYTPIIAHPERNKAIMENPNKLYELVFNGAMAQITAGSLAGHFGGNIQKFSLQLVQSNLVHTYGSDIHNLTTRPFLFDAGLSYLEKNKQLNAVDLLLENNARVVENRDFVLYEPERVKTKKWWQIF